MSSSASAQLKLTVICFSKDRPWQLQELLRSVLAFWIGPYEYHVLYQTSSDAFERAYQCLMTELYKVHSHIHFVKEKDFCSDLFQLMNTAASQYLCFHVDDTVFYRAFDIQSALHFLHEPSHRIFAFFPKLNEQISYSHPASTAAPTPTFTTKLKFKKYNLWMPMKATSDWNYLWDLCGAIYSKEHALTIFNGIKAKFSSAALSSPNKFEVHGNKLINLIYPGFGMDMKLFAACPKKAIMSVITVNRVQTDYNVPIYDEHQMNTAQLLQYFVQERELDFKRYAQQTFNSVHIYALHLLPPKLKLTQNRAMLVNMNREEEKETHQETNAQKSPQLDETEINEWIMWLRKHCDEQPKEIKKD